MNTKDSIKAKRMQIGILYTIGIVLIGALLLAIVLTHSELNKYNKAFFTCLIVFAMGIGLAVVGNVVRRISVDTAPTKEGEKK